MATLSETLRALLAGKIGTQKLSHLTGIPKTTIDSWLDGTVRRPRDWRPLLSITQALLLSRTEAEALLAAAGHLTITELAQRLRWDHPDRACLQHWLEQHEVAQVLAPSEAKHEPPTQPQDSSTPLPRRHQLPAPVRDFVGRRTEALHVREALGGACPHGAATAIVGISGMGGIGKTELTYQIAHRLTDVFPDAQLVVDLRGSHALPLSPAQALQSIIAALMPQAPLPDAPEALEALYRSVLHGQRVLILADDARDAVQVRPLLPPDGSALLITSRQRFSLPGMLTVDLEQLSEADAIALLHNICGRLDDDEARLIACTCEYLPLALRISAGILHNDRALPVGTFIARLSQERHRLAQLCDPDDPQLDVAASLALSYTLLSAPAQQVFRQLGVIAADFSLPLALATVATSAGVDVATTLRLLLRRNLVMYDAERDRWRLHDLVRDLAQTLLRQAHEHEGAGWRYAQAAVQLAQVAQAHYQAGGDRMLTALALFDTERPHIDAGYRWADTHAETAPGDQLLLDLAQAGQDIGNLRYAARHERLPRWQAVYAAAQRRGNQRSTMQALRNMGFVHQELGETHHAISCYLQALTLAQTLHDRASEGANLNNLGLAYTSLGEPQRAIPYLKDYVAIAQELGNRCAEGIGLGNLGGAYAALEEPHLAILHYEQAIALVHTAGHRRFEGYTLGNLGRTYAEQGNWTQAVKTCEASISIARALDDRRMEGYALSYLAYTQASRGDGGPAAALFTQAMALLREVGDRWGEAEGQWLFGLALVQQGAQDKALPLLRASLAYEQEIGHAKAAEHADLLAWLESGRDLPTAQHLATRQPAAEHDKTAYIVSLGGLQLPNSR